MLYLPWSSMSNSLTNKARDKVIAKTNNVQYYDLDVT